MSPTFTIAETVLENVCSNLHHRDTTKCSLPLLLVCVSLIFLMMSCDKSYVKQALWLRIARPMCDGRSFSSSPFRRLASRGSFFCGVTLWCFFFSNCGLGKCSCLVRSSIRHYVLLFPYCPMAWSMLTLAQERDEIDLTCFRVSSFGSLTCYVGLMSFEWPSAPSGGLVQSGHSLSQEDANDEHPENAHCTRPHLRWRHDAILFIHQKCSHIDWTGTYVRIFLMAVFDVLLGIREGQLDLQHLHNCPENRNTSLVRGLLRIMMSFAFKKFTGRMNSSRLIRFLSLNLEKTTGRRKHRVMSSHVRDVITLFVFILVILFLWSLMSISSLTWLCEEPSWTTTPYFSTLALSPWSIWGYGWRCQHLWTWARQIQRFGLRLSRMAMQERLQFFSVFSRTSLRLHSRTSQGRMLRSMV